jgi:hypothetical protein
MRFIRSYSNQMIDKIELALSTAQSCDMDISGLVDAGRQCRRNQLWFAPQDAFNRVALPPP